MDFNKLTIKSGEAVAGAQELARRAGNPELIPAHLTVALLEQELPRTLLRACRRRRELDPGRGRGAPAGAAGRVGLERAATGWRCVPQGARRRLRRGAQARRRVRLGRASRTRARPRAARGAARRAEGGARRPACDDAGSRGHLRGTDEVRPRSHRCGRGRQARPRDRSRRGDPPHDPGALAPHEEQPGADR